MIRDFPTHGVCFSLVIFFLVIKTVNLSYLSPVYIEVTGMNGSHFTKTSIIVHVLLNLMCVASIRLQGIFSLTLLPVDLFAKLC